MNASELRIGNWIMGKGFSGLAPQKVSGATVYGIMAFNVEGYLNYIAPIPLTPEILKNAGFIWNDDTQTFEKHLGGDARMHLTYRELNGSYTMINYVLGAKIAERMFNYVLEAIIAERMFYLHQLQNLYFALTGEELNIEL